MALSEIKEWHQAYLRKSGYQIDLSVGAESTNVVTITGQIQDADGTDLEDTFTLMAGGEDPAEFTLAVTTGTGLSKTARGFLAFETDSTGTFVVTVTDVGGGFGGVAAIKFEMARNSTTSVPAGYAEPALALCTFD